MSLDTMSQRHGDDCGAQTGGMVKRAQKIWLVRPTAFGAGGEEWRSTSRFWQTETIRGYPLFFGRQVRTTNPVLNTCVSTSSRSVLNPSWNNREPPPRTTGNTQKRNSSINPWSSSVRAN